MVAGAVAVSWYTFINHLLRVLPPTIQRERISPVTWLLLLQVSREERTVVFRQREISKKGVKLKKGSAR